MIFDRAIVERVRSNKFLASKAGKRLCLPDPSKRKRPDCDDSPRLPIDNFPELATRRVTDTIIARHYPIEEGRTTLLLQPAE